MFRSLHMKLVLIMTLLIISLMTVVGAFLINSVVGYYLQDFHQQMEEAFTDQTFLSDLQNADQDEEEGAQQIAQVLEAYNRSLGVDNRSRWYYVLDGITAQILASSDDSGTGEIPDTITRNLSLALMGESGSESDISAEVMDMAIPITRGDNSYIIYILDSKETVTTLNNEFINMILGALLFGIVISVLLSFLLAKTMITPIEQLTQGAERVAGGNFAHKIEVASRDEIGVLTGTFNNMARRLEETLEEAENERNKLDTIFLYMTDGVVAFSQEGTIIHANPAAGHMLDRVVAVDGDETYQTLFGQVAPLEGVLAVEQTGYLDGTIEVGGQSLSLLMAPFNKERQVGVLVVIRDITQQMKTEEMRREFVANVSHELRTPLTNIRSYAETLAENAGTLPPEMEGNFLEVILSESDRMTHIVQDLLTLSRFDSGYSALHLQPFSLGDAVQETYQATLMESQRHGHTMELFIEPNLPHVVGDKDRILQVVTNVLSNAIKYTPDGGVIAMNLKQVEQELWLEVSDNGIGIPEEDRSRIFDRFYRVDKARSRESGGTGLGLSIAMEIVGKHQGRMELVEREGPGLTVRIALLVEGPQ